MQHVPLSSSDQRMENTTCSCCARNEKGESDYSVSWKRVSTIIWVDTYLEDKVRHRRPPQIARYTVTYRSPAEPRINASTSGYRHQNIQYNGCFVASETNTLCPERATDWDTQRICLSDLSTNHREREPSAENTSQRYSTLRNEKRKKKIKAGSHEERDNLNLNKRRKA